jgi:uncharacterized SAM-binding protein YcdF (DUF218 family)
MLFWPFKLAFRVVGVVLALVLVYVGVTFVQVWLTSSDNDPHLAGAALVFGTATNYRTPRADLKARLQRALSLYNKQLVPLIAVTGGKRPGDRYTEAQISAMWLEAHRVPAAHIVVGSGADTYQNVASVASQLRADQVHSVLVVTDPFHEDRAMATTSGFGFSPSATPSLRSPIGGFTLFQFFAEEAVEVAAGRILGYGTLSSWIHS